MRLTYLTGRRGVAGRRTTPMELRAGRATKPSGRSLGQPRCNLQAEEGFMTKSENRCAHCGGKLGLVSHHFQGLRFCRKGCKESFLARTATNYACMRRWFGFGPRKAS
jgi:ribosomal protein S14